MLKRILFTLMMISMLIFGSSTAWAGSPLVNEQSQTIEGAINQDQEVDTDETDEETTQEQSITTVVEQSTRADEKSGEKEEGQAISTASAESERDDAAQVTAASDAVEESEAVEDEAAAEQEETEADGDTAAAKKGESNESAASATVQSKKEEAAAVKTAVESDEASHSQEQSVEIIAEQTQTVKEADHVDADQEQDITLEYKQKLKVTKEDQQSQYQKIVTEQDQSISTPHETDFVEQSLKTEIDTKQSGEINLEAERNSSIQETSVKMKETHESETSGDALIKQEQSVAAKAVSKDTTSEGFSIKAVAENSVEIIKDAASAVVNVVQLIFVNDEEVASFDQEFQLDEKDAKNSQVYSQVFEWGTLFVLNKVFVDQTEDGDVYSKLKSIIKLDFILPKEKTVAAASNADDSCFNDSDCDGLTDDEERKLGTDPYNPDTDGDGLTDYQEVRIYFTNPLNPDTDGDGRTDYEEVYVYFSNPLIPDAVGSR